MATSKARSLEIEPNRHAYGEIPSAAITGSSRKESSRPAIRLATGRVSGCRSQAMRMIDVIGTARNPPTMPHSIPQKINEMRMVTGCSFMCSPISFGWMKLPIDKLNGGRNEDGH